MARPLWFRNLLKAAFPSRFLLAEMTKVPLVASVVDHYLFRGDALHYLPEDKVLQINEPVGAPVETILPSQIVEHFVNQANHLWIMDTCICRDASNCRDYPIDLGCLFLGQAANGINPQLGRAVTREEALDHVERCREAGLVHLVGRNRLDTVWLGVGPGEKLLTICNCCPCCCLWRMLPQIAPEIGAKITRLPGVTVAVTEDCQGCGTCAQDVCFVDAIRLVDGKSFIDDECRGCGRCVDVCPEGAIRLSVDDPRLIESSVHSLSFLVDVS
jgi:ferredoxin